ncbi:pyridoxine 5'-phosphate synthase [Helicobacter brantae]|uniref:Pyridoxine 5'-phosphate synthase n=1 Tax=Helicobacter brantae TaxID=375927 RepID=A0A3D8J4V0_9HELI|nr:pyridoxine 5'-phosphate synthase [Helicobacter brantae]RDU71801.1 pyridoxine 5'-phosphate synthase [Helicobacter brantae]
MKLGVNIDHIATLREARKINEPNPLEAVFLLKNAGASQVTLHLREDRRHIHDEDFKAIVSQSFLPINLECASSMVEQVISYSPHRITLVPEKREEVTTEGGLNLAQEQVRNAIKKLHFHSIPTSLFIDPKLENIQICKELGVQSVELHTGEWANLNLMAYTNLRHTHNAIPSLDLPLEVLEEKMKTCLKEIQECSKLAKELGLEVFAGHGLNYQNVSPIATITEISELNIGHSIIARAVFVGLSEAVREMRELIER